MTPSLVIIVSTHSQQCAMNDATVQQLAVAIQALAALATAAPPPPVAPAAPNFISPYEGDALDLSSRTGTSLFQKGSKPLDTKFTGKAEDLHQFLADLKDHAETCHWNSPTHGILSLPLGAPPITYNLLEDYGKVTDNQVKAACVTWMTGPDIRAKQNAQMKYNASRTPSLMKQSQQFPHMTLIFMRMAQS